MIRRSAVTMAAVLLTTLTGCADVGSQPPGRTLIQAGEALNQVSGYHIVIENDATPPAHKVRLELDVRVPGGARGTFQSGDVSGQVRFAADTVYGQGRAFSQFYLGQIYQVAANQVDRYVGDQWFKALPGHDPVFTLASSPTALAACLGGTHGVLTGAGATRIAGYDVNRFVDAGTGTTAAQSYAIASSGPPLPVQIAQTADGPPDGCHFGKGITITLSHFGEHVFLDLPPSPVDLAAPPA